jgi:colicin import membrane protein
MHRHHPFATVRHLALVFTLASALLLAGTAMAARAPTVELADLSQVSTEGQDSLKDVQHEVQLAETAVSGARVAVDEAKEELKISKSTLAGRKADLKAAKQERVAAKKNDDAERLASADARVSSASAALAETKARLAWAKKNLVARKAEVDLAKANLALAQANLELARAELLSAEGVTAAENYALADFRGHQAKQAQAFHKASEKTQKKIGAADKAKASWESRLVSG